MAASILARRSPEASSRERRIPAAISLERRSPAAISPARRSPVATSRARRSPTGSSLLVRPQAATTSQRQCPNMAPTLSSTLTPVVGWHLAASWRRRRRSTGTRLGCRRPGSITPERLPPTATMGTRQWGQAAFIPRRRRRDSVSLCPRQMGTTAGRRGPTSAGALLQLQLPPSRHHAHEIGSLDWLMTIQRFRCEKFDWSAL